MPEVDAAKIAALNDHARQTFQDCRVVVTRGIEAITDVQAILHQVRVFDQKRWHYLTQQYQCTKSQNQWCAIYCAIGCLFRPTQKHCVQHRKAAIDWLERFWPPFLFLLTLIQFYKMCRTLLRGKERRENISSLIYLLVVLSGESFPNKLRPCMLRK